VISNPASMKRRPGRGGDESPAAAENPAGMPDGPAAMPAGVTAAPTPAGTSSAPAVSSTVGAEGMGVHGAPPVPLSRRGSLSAGIGPTAAAQQRHLADREAQLANREREAALREHEVALREAQSAQREAQLLAREAVAERERIERAAAEREASLLAELAALKASASATPAPASPAPATPSPIVTPAPSASKATEPVAPVTPVTPASASAAAPPRTVDAPTQQKMGVTEDSVSGLPEFVMIKGRLTSHGALGPALAKSGALTTELRQRSQHGLKVARAI